MLAMMLVIGDLDYDHHHRDFDDHHDDSDEKLDFEGSFPETVNRYHNNNRMWHSKHRVTRL